VNSKQFQDLLQAARKRQDKILESKGQDYTASNDDRLYNFKFIGQVLDLDPKLVWAVYFLKHVLALMNRAKGGKESEPVEGRMDDVANYVVLLAGLLAEEKVGVLLPPDYEELVRDEACQANTCDCSLRWNEGFGCPWHPSSPQQRNPDRVQKDEANQRVDDPGRGPVVGASAGCNIWKGGDCKCREDSPEIVRDCSSSMLGEHEVALHFPSCGVFKKGETCDCK